MAIRPPGRQTRLSSEATTSGRGANMAPNIESTTSNRAGFVGDFFRIAFDEFNFELLLCGAFAGLLQEIRGDVESDDFGSGAGGGDGLVSGAAGYVEDFCSWLEVQALDEAFSFAGIQLGDLTEVASHPGGAQALLQFCEIIRDCGHGILL